MKNKRNIIKLLISCFLLTSFFQATFAQKISNIKHIFQSEKNKHIVTYELDTKLEVQIIPQYYLQDSLIILEKYVLEKIKYTGDIFSVKSSGSKQMICDFSKVKDFKYDNLTIKLICQTRPFFQSQDKSNFSKWVSQDIRYPQSCLADKVQGIVKLTFEVDIDGSVINVKVIQGVDPELDREAVRVVMNSPKWQPGSRNGEPIKTSVMFPVSFTLKK